MLRAATLFAFYYPTRGNFVGKSAQGTLNPIFPRAGGTLINQGTLMRQMLLTTIFVYSSVHFYDVYFYDGLEKCNM